MYLTLPAGVMAAAFDLADAGDSDSFTVAAGMTETRGGVNFTCDSAYPCTVTLTNSAGTLVAKYMTQKDMEADTAMVMAAAVPVPPPEPMPVEFTSTLELSALAQDRLKAVPGLTDAGDSTTVDIPAGETVTRAASGNAGVMFMCDSMYDCRVTISNSAGTITATMVTMRLPDSDDPMVMVSAPAPVDTFAELNAGSTDAIRADVTGNADDAGATAPMFTATELIGMGIGGPGVLNADDAGLRSDFQANGANFGASPGDTAAAPGAVPALTMGQTITGAMDAIDASDDMGSAPDGWGMKTLFRDWGDTAGDGDGGYETAAIVVKNLGEGTPYPFDRDLHDMYANVPAQAMFDLSILASGGPPTVVSLGTSVSINADGVVTGNFTASVQSMQWANMVFDSDSLVPAQSQDLLIDVGETFTGSYFGAPGQFQCISGGPSNESCALARNDDGTVGVNNISTTEGMTDSTGRWSFTPDPGAMITVPDQDWMAYGAWLTTPDNPDGGAEAHRLGVFFNGIDTWVPATEALLSTGDNALRGKATYSGGATGVYVDGEDSGLFTARAMLEAVFDADGVVQDADQRISGRIDNFRGTDGVYLGDDTQASPNDPTAGENDWVVELGAIDFTDTTTGTLSTDTDNVTGSADGVAWTGRWNGQFFGPSGTQAKPLAPSGVAGQFWAETVDPLTADTTDPDVDAATVGPVTAVVGAFGATKDD